MCRDAPLMEATSASHIANTPFWVNPFKSCWYLCEGGKVLRELPPQFFHHWKEVQNNTLPSFNTVIISGRRKHVVFQNLVALTACVVPHMQLQLLDFGARSGGWGIQNSHILRVFLIIGLDTPLECGAGMWAWNIKSFYCRS